MNKQHYFGLILLGILLSISACIQPPNYPDEPVISNPILNKNEIRQGRTGVVADTLIVEFDFTDGDGDLSFPEDSIDVFMADSRFPEDLISFFRLPAISEQGVGNGISGEITIRQSSQPGNICCIVNNFPCGFSETQPRDTFSYEIQIRDRAGNFSNKIRTELITILCLED